MGKIVVITKANWIDVKGGQQEDSHAEFKGSFSLPITKKLHLIIACDSDYAFYLNGSLVSFSSFPDYPYHRVADEITLEGKAGFNYFKILTYYCGATSFSSYCPGPSGLLFEIRDDDNVIAYSEAKTLSRLSKCYANGLKKPITPQLGYSFSYDARNEDDDTSWLDSDVVLPRPTIYRRDNQKCVLSKPIDGQLIHVGVGHYLVDLKSETAGLLYLSFISTHPQKLHISYGEHLENGKVPEIIESRDFGFDYYCKKGKNEFLPFCRRLGARYLELVFEEGVKVNCFSIRPFNYPFKEIPYYIDSSLRQRIYDVSVKTLKCCYHEHYEDCPWREQCLYILDSSNQMRCGYYCFDNPETMRSSLALILRSERKDGLLPICAPTSLDFVIPSFNLHLFEAVEEYVKHTGDISFLKESYPRMKRVIDSFVSQVKDGHLLNFEGSNYWNFYEWRDGLDGAKTNQTSDLISSCLFLLALESMGRLSRLINEEDSYSSLASSLQKSFHSQFFSSKHNLYSMYEGEKGSYSELGNSLAILSGLSTGDEANEIATILKQHSSSLVPVSLSCLRFLYDALLKVSLTNQEFILDDIDYRYRKMLDSGATTFYETELGAKDFNGAGSLCHGWSALPIYYYHLFGIGKKDKHPVNVIGLDVGGTKVKGGLFSNGQLVKTLSLSVDKTGGREGMFKTIEQVIDSLGTKDLDHIGVVSAGNIDVEKGVCLFSVNINGWTGAPIKKTLEDKYHVPVYVDNDAIGAVLGELSFLNHPQNVTVLTFGTGVGGASLINGKLNREKYSEWGHHELIHNGRACSCGKKGCAERYLSATALLEDANKVLPVLDTIALMEEFKKGNKLAIGVIEHYCKWLNAFIDLIYQEIKPDTIILGGGLMNAKDVFSRFLTPHQCAVSFALGGNNAGIIGASLLPEKLGK